MKAAFTLAALVLFTTAAQAGTQLSCSYLASGSGAPYPGLSRPQVMLDETRADVEIIMEGGRGTVSRVHYSLAPVGRSRSSTTYMDPTREVRLISNASGGAVLTVKGLVSRCSL